MFRRTFTTGAMALGILFLAGPAFACGGLIGPRGNVQLLRTTTLAAYHNGVEHYITSFRYSGAESTRFGSIVPLPGVPSTVERGGDWTLQRLIRETSPPQVFAAEDAAAAGTRKAEVLLETRIDALDITVLKGGAGAVVEWATENGFELSDDTPEVLDYYARRSPIFMAARFDAEAAQGRGQQAGDGTPIHVTIPTPNPWVPLRILALGKPDKAPVEADIYLLTDGRPSLLASNDPSGLFAGLRIGTSAPASATLLDDLRSDKGMGWVPASMWLTHLPLDATAADVKTDLAIDATGQNTPSRLAAGFFNAVREADGPQTATMWPPILALVAFLAFVVGRRARLGDPR